MVKLIEFKVKDAFAQFSHSMSVGIRDYSSFVCSTCWSRSQLHL